MCAEDAVLEYPNQG